MQSVVASLTVQPAASFPRWRRADCRLAILNHTPTPLDAQAELVVNAPVGEVLSGAVRAVGGRGRL